MRKKQLIILGAGVMQGPAIRTAKSLGFEAIVVDGDPNAPCVQEADRFENIDLKDKEGVEALARSLRLHGRLAGIMTAGTDFSASVAWVAERLGLPGLPYEAALNASDKERMRSCFKRDGVPSPAFTTLSAAPDANWKAPFPFPVVVKPVDNMGARGCRRADTFEGLREAVRDALPFSRSKRIIIEEYMEGPEFSVDAIVCQGEITIAGLADRHITFPPYFIEMGHTMPADLDPETADSLLSVFKAGVRSLGVANGAAKGDVKLTPKGPMIGEIAARLSGGYMSGWTYPYASGVDVTRAAIGVAIGENPMAIAASLMPSRNWTSAERAFISIPGVVRSIEGCDAARAVPYVRDIFLRVKPGDTARFPVNNVSKAGNVIAAAPTRAEAVRAAESAARSLLARLETPNEGTTSFLENDGATGVFPPSAYTVSPEIQNHLEKLPPGIEKNMNCPYNKNVLERSAGQALSIIAFPEFETAEYTDWLGRTARESLKAIRTLTGLSLPVKRIDRAACSGMALGRGFWKALIRGGYQGAVYLIDSLMSRG
ncbi:MAG: ATP-grasp domain-containing protein [Treponema sp.]|jgi:biotin carboxylase|nr:ATP-grasp domain-containing protein [Treponema sp.]